DIPERTTPPPVTQPATQTFGTLASYPPFTHATVPEVISPPSPPSSRQSQYKQQGSRRSAILRRIRQTTGSLEEIPIFLAAKRPRTDTPYPTSPPLSHWHFAPIVTSPPMVSKLRPQRLSRHARLAMPHKQYQPTSPLYYIPPPPPTIRPRQPKTNALRPTAVPLMQLDSKARRTQQRAQQQNRQHDPYYATPSTAAAEQQNYMALLPPPRYTTVTAKPKKPYAQPKNVQQHTPPPPTDLVDEPRQQGYPAQRYQQRDTTTATTNKPNHVILSDSTMSRFRLSQFNNSTVSVRIKSNSGFGIRDYINQVTSGQLRYLLEECLSEHI
ncbi:unnamed protein product, partial [Didymodactylos carnosus]